MSDFILAELIDAQAALEHLIEDKQTQSNIEWAATQMAACLKQGNKIVACGNGGSMCDAMHFAEELSGRYREDRPSYAAIAISDPSHLSCVANDYGYEHVFSRWIEAHGRAGDCLLAISTSGSSKNVLRACQEAKSRGMMVIGLTGKAGSPLQDVADKCIVTPGGQYADRVQELHIKVIHIKIGLIERLMKEK
ncbi:SIS domain-containing protein [Kamptonema cortianum]|nr:SIS domain-containing protein [Geitlerinema splendidum]MDK3158800.1 SIS domain-containing protein [Kamptonema cortianum]